MHVVGSKPCMGGAGRYDSSNGGRMNRHNDYDDPPYRSRRPNHIPNRYYGGNSNLNEQNSDIMQKGGKRKSKKSRRTTVEYGSMMLYGGKTLKTE